MFLLVLSSITLAIIISILPETMRRISGNGSVKLRGVYKPLVNLNKGSTGEPHLSDEQCSNSRPRVSLTTLIEPVLLLLRQDVIINLIYGGIIYTVWSMVTSSTTSLFKQRFGLDEMQIGLCYLPNGVGTIFGSMLAGKLMSREWARTEVAYNTQRDLSSDFKLASGRHVPDDFPIERCRMAHLWWVSCLFVAATSAYGFAMTSSTIGGRAVWIAVPLTLQFLIAGASNAVFAMNQTLICDICPGRGASATAVNNLVRCGLAALGVAFVEQMIRAVGPNYTFLCLGGIVVMSSPLAVLSWMCGQRWRSARSGGLEVLDNKQ